jgi:hypothetical protein
MESSSIEGMFSSIHVITGGAAVNAGIVVLLIRNFFRCLVLAPTR